MYYYQVQQQLFTTKSNYCDFVVCAFDEKNQPVFVHQRIVPDQAHWDRVAPKLETFLRVCILPEILGRWYTRKIDLSSFTEKRTGDASVEWMMTSQQLNVAISHARSPHSTCHA